MCSAGGDLQRSHRLHTRSARQWGRKVRDAKKRPLTQHVLNPFRNFKCSCWKSHEIFFPVFFLLRQKGVLLKAFQKMEAEGCEVCD